MEIQRGILRKPLQGSNEDSEGRGTTIGEVGKRAKFDQLQVHNKLCVKCNSSVIYSNNNILELV